MPSKETNSLRDQPEPSHLHDFTSLQELPDSYKWTQLDDHRSSAAADQSLLVIDLLNTDAVQNIGNACKTWGAFQVINHGVPIPILDSIEDITKSLFSLPFHQKIKAEKSPDSLSGYGRLKISSCFSQLMWSEGFTIVGSPLEHFRQLWPQGHATFCNKIEEYKTEMKRLAGRLMWLMLGPLGITMEEDIKWAGPNGDFEEASAVLQLIHYPVCPDPDQAMGLAAHTDSTLLTILHQNNTSGLLVSKEGTGWVNVPPVSGGLVINVGDLLHILSNGSYPSVAHRAKVNQYKDRFSMVYLYGPPSNIPISPLPKLVGPTHPPLYRPVFWKEYLDIKANHFNEGLPFIRVNDPLTQLLDVNEHNNIAKIG